MTSPPTVRQKFRRRTAVAMIAAGTTLFATALAGLAPSASASSHREAPQIAGLPQLDNTDVYSFTSPDKPTTVTLVANWIPFEEPNGGPNFYPFAPGAHYDINIDNDGDGKPDVTYRWVFHNVDKRDGKTFLYNNGPVTNLDDENLLFKQNYTLMKIEKGHETVILKDATAAPSDVGVASMPNYKTLRDEAIRPLALGGQTYAGQADDPFFLDLRVFDLLYGGNLSEVGQDTLRGYNVNTLAIQVPKENVALNHNATANPVIGVWSATSQQSMTLSTAGAAKPTGKFVQVSRLGNPLVNELISAADQKDAFNASSPDQDHTNKAFLARVVDPELARDIETFYKIPAPSTPRNDLVEIFATGVTTKAGGPIKADLNSQLNNKDVDGKGFVPAEEERLNMAVPVTKAPNRLGVLGGDLQGFPNGRRLTDDVVDIEIQTVEGAFHDGLPPKPVAALATGDKVNANDVPFGAAFPYVALPHNQSVNTAGPGTPGAAPAGGPAAGSPLGNLPLPLPLTGGMASLVLIGSGTLLFRNRPKHAKGSESRDS